MRQKSTKPGIKLEEWVHPGLITDEEQERLDNLKRKKGNYCSQRYHRDLKFYQKYRYLAFDRSEDRVQNMRRAILDYGYLQITGQSGAKWNVSDRCFESSAKDSRIVSVFNDLYNRTRTKIHSLSDEQRVELELGRTVRI